MPEPSVVPAPKVPEPPDPAAPAPKGYRVALPLPYTRGELDEVIRYVLIAWLLGFQPNARLVRDPASIVVHLPEGQEEQVRGVLGSLFAVPLLFEGEGPKIEEEP